jgi:hypothetical protein
MLGMRMRRRRRLLLMMIIIIRMMLVTPGSTHCAHQTTQRAYYRPCFARPPHDDDDVKRPTRFY